MLQRATFLRGSLVLFVLAALLAFGLAPAGADEPQSPRNEALPESSFDFAPWRMLRRRFATERPPGKYERRHTTVVHAFREVVADPGKSTVEIICDHETTGLGAVVAANGYILTKASDLKGKTVCKLRDNRRYEAELIGVNKEHDLALLKINVDGLTPVVWTDQSDTPVGSWLATPGLGEDPLSIGVLSAAARSIAAIRPILGVLLAQADVGPRIDEIMPGSGAEKAELKVGDLIVGVNGAEVQTRESLIQRIGRFQPGDVVRLTVRRGDEEVNIEAMLGPLPDDGEVNRHEFQNHLGGALSKRRAGFPSVFQHDTVLQPHECGGQIVDLNGHAVGINIARAGRVASFAIPATVVKEVLASLMKVQPVSLDASAATRD
ncbi:MAG: PDZ domain-containing protein [Planctomycetes bacterium]|nr:PDZ domain-containing protein [Planctomycetota bacterium]